LRGGELKCGANRYLRRPHVFRCDPTGTNHRSDVRTGEQATQRSATQSILEFCLNARPITTFFSASPQLLRMRLRFYLAFRYLLASFGSGLLPDMKDTRCYCRCSAVRHHRLQTHDARVAEKCITNLSAKEKAGCTAIVLT
jgi:hypothetical protein